MIANLLDPFRWGLNHLICLVLFLTGLNLFGPRGFVHLYYLKKESERVELEKKVLTSTISRLEREITHFQSSKNVRARAIRQHLGYLAENEISVELPENLQNNQIPTKPTKILR